MKRPPLKPVLVSILVVTAAAGGLVLTRGAARSRAMSAAAFDGRPSVFQAGLSGGSVAAKESAASPEDALAAMEASRKLVRNATLSLEVVRYGDSAAKAEAIVAAQGGFLADAQVSRESGDHERGSLTLRVPAERFEAVLRSLKALGRLDGASVSTQDVGKEYMDLETRLEAKRDTESRLRELLRNRTARLADVLAAEKELSRVIEEREALEGERRYYDRQVALSTITIDLHEPAAFFRENALAPLREALGRALPLISASVAALVYAIAAALPWVLLAYGLWRLFRRQPARPVPVPTER
jgi:hypothetical protein